MARVAASAGEKPQDLMSNAVERSALYLDTPTVCYLANACRALHKFLQNTHMNLFFGMDVALDSARGMRGWFSQETVFLHSLTSLTRAAQLAHSLRWLDVKGEIAFSNEDEIASLEYIVALEGACSAPAERFFVLWNFNPGKVAALLEGQCLDPVCSAPVGFHCKNDLLFVVKLVISRSTMDNRCLQLNLTEAEVIGDCLTCCEITVAGSVIIPGEHSSVVCLLPAVNAPGPEQDAESTPLVARACEEVPTFAQLRSLVRVNVPSWCQPVCLFAQLRSIVRANLPSWCLPRCQN